MLHEANEEGERMSVTITDEMIEARLAAEDIDRKREEVQG